MARFIYARAGRKYAGPGAPQDLGGYAAFRRVQGVKQWESAPFLECGDSSPLSLAAPSLNSPLIGSRLGSLHHRQEGPSTQLSLES